MDVTEIGCKYPGPVIAEVLGTGVIWAVFRTSVSNRNWPI